jgi:methionyl-tRNA synthetase
MKKSFYITTTLPYVNSEPHLGFAMEIVRADVIARAKELQGFDVFFNTGTDEHGLKVLEKAKELNKDPQDYVDEIVKKYLDLKKVLNLKDDMIFTRTTSKDHKKAAQEFWKICDKNGYIYKKKYKSKYCVGCELEKTDSEIENGHCIIHPNLELVIVEEENYFFKFSEFQRPLLEFYAKRPDFVIPEFRFREIKAFIDRGLSDFSISRLKSKMSWGVEVPEDSSHVMYVWFDALVNYISALGWPSDTEKFEKYWINGTPVQYCGKDNLRQQAAMWQAMLMAVGLSQSHNIIIDGFINSGGQKMSKSLGNVISPFGIVSEYGADPLRYYLCRELSMFEDSDVTLEKFKEVYNANLANGLGNLVSRVMKMAEDNLGTPVKISEFENMSIYFEFLNNFEIGKACDHIWLEIGSMDAYIQQNQPFKLIKTNKEEGQKMIENLLVRLYSVARMLNPIMPETSTKIKELIKNNKSPKEPLFLRKD